MGRTPTGAAAGERADASLQLPVPSSDSQRRTTSRPAPIGMSWTGSAQAGAVAPRAPRGCAKGSTILVIVNSTRLARFDFCRGCWKHCISNAAADTPCSTMALVAWTRCRVQEFFEDSNTYLGMTQYETRSWVGWQHHMTLVGLAHLFVTLAQKRSKRIPELTLDRTVRLLEAALEEPRLRLLRATAFCGVPRAAERGGQDVAREEAWRAKHRGVITCGCRTTHAPKVATR